MAGPCGSRATLGLGARDQRRCRERRYRGSRPHDRLRPRVRGYPRWDGSVRANAARGRARWPARCRGPVGAQLPRLAVRVPQPVRRGTRRPLRPRHVRVATRARLLLRAVGLPALSRVRARRPDGRASAWTCAATRAAAWRGSCRRTGSATLGAIALLWGGSGTPGIRLPAASDLPLFAIFGQNYSLDTIMRLNPVTWTLCVEAAFYVLLPLLGALAWRTGPRAWGRQALLVGALIPLGIAWNQLGHDNGWNIIGTEGAAGLPAVLRLRDAAGAVGGAEARARRACRSARARPRCSCSAASRSWPATPTGTRRPRPRCGERAACRPRRRPGRARLRARGGRGGGGRRARRRAG